MRLHFPNHVWKYIEQYLSKGIAGVTTVVLAWFLDPEVFASFSIIVVVFLYANGIVDSGLSLSLIREKNNTKIDLNTIFFTNLFLSIFCFLLIFLMAPYISEFYNAESLTKLLRVAACSVLLQAFIIVPRSLLTKKMEFRTQFIITSVSMLIASLLSIASAIMSVGAWSLVIQMLSYSLFCAIGYCYLVRWPIGWHYSTERLRVFWNYSKYLLFDLLISIPFANIYLLVLPKYYDFVLVGLYYFAHNIKETMIGIFVKSFQSVSFAKIALELNDGKNLITNARMTLSKLTLFIFPIITILILIVENLFLYLMPNQWFAAHKYLELLLCVSYFFVLNAFFQNIFKVGGYSKIVFYLGLVRKIVVLVTLAITYDQGITLIIFGQIFVGAVSLLFNSVFASRVISYNMIYQFSDISHAVMFTLISMSLAKIILIFLPASHLLGTLLEVVIFCLLYICLVLFLAKETLQNRSNV